MGYLNPTTLRSLCETGDKLVQLDDEDSALTAYADWVREGADWIERGHPEQTCARWINLGSLRPPEAPSGGFTSHLPSRREESNQNWWVYYRMLVNKRKNFLTELSCPGSDHVQQMRMRQDLQGETIFIVHGHDNEAKTVVARFVEGLGLETIILHEQPNRGRTIIEKLEEYSDVGFAIVILTADDKGCAKGGTDLRGRARQNVILELGYFLGGLGRDRVVALVKGDVERPSDIDGVVYQVLDQHGGWMGRMARELREAGFDVDLNRVA